MRIVWIGLIVIVIAAGAYVVTRFERSAPSIRTQTAEVFVGTEHRHAVSVDDEGTGLRQIRIWLEKDGREFPLYDESFPGDLLQGAVSRSPRGASVVIRAKELGLRDGPGRLHVAARDFAWSANIARVEIPVVIDTQAPRVALETGLTYVRRGGAEVAVYGVDEEGATHGVEIGTLRFPGFPHPDRPGRHLAFYVLLPDTPPDQLPVVVAIDRAGNRTAVSIPVQVIERRFPTDEIRLSEGFMERKVRELLGQSEKSTLDAYLEINNEMRIANDEQIQRVCRESSAERLWAGAFQQLPNSYVGARFAERRSYTYDGREVDTQVHMGYDLASTQHAPIPAANAGVVVFAEPLGIYGTTVIVDHGLGLFSLYGHLSEVAVEKGQAIAAGDRLGNTGVTGLAGGDHLHFAVLVNGVFTDPLEWFDARWIRDHIEPKLGGEAAAVEEG
jgi:hypothetical protein